MAVNLTKRIKGMGSVSERFLKPGFAGPELTNVTATGC
jgi:hypothetical protein